MTDQYQAVRPVTLLGSAILIRKYLSYAINQIIFQRGIVQVDSFETVEQFGLRLWICRDSETVQRIQFCLNEAEESILKKDLNKVIFVMLKPYTKEVLEKWEFEIEYECQNGGTSERNQQKFKDLKTIQAEICSVLKQIIGTISILPIINANCDFDIVLQVFPGSKIPPNWTPIDYSLTIDDSKDFYFRPLFTFFHEVQTRVIYRKI